jgi:TonB family protein
LFSSAQETSRPLIQALKELELGVEYCPEIFAAIKELTKRSFEVIVADLDDGPEAEFLLKTARELRTSQNAFVLAVAGKTPKVPAKHSQADLVLTKPIIPDQVKYALLTCDRFLADMRNWIGKSHPAEALKPPLKRPDSAPVAPEVRSAKAILAALPPVPSPALAGTSARSRLASTSLDPARFATRHRRAKPMWDSLPQPRSGGNIRNRFLWATVLIVVVLLFTCAFAYRFQGRRILARVATAVWRASEETYQRVAESRKHQPSEPENVGSENPEVIRVSTSRANGSAETEPASLRVAPVFHPEVSNQALFIVPEQPQAKANPLPDHVSTVTAFIAIPESMKLQQPEADAFRQPFGRPSPSLLGELEPVLLSEDTAERLLLEKVEPSYPVQALKTGLQGSVVLQAWIARDGSMQDLKLVSGSLVLGQAAYEAVKHWRYKPFLRNGKAVTAQTYVTVNFRLPQQSLVSYPR